MTQQIKMINNLRRGQTGSKAVLIPAPGFRGDKFLTYKYETSANYSTSWDVLEGEGLEPGREISRGGLEAALADGSWKIRAKKSR